jgi:hypothetical protein
MAPEVWEKNDGKMRVTAKTFMLIAAYDDELIF